MADVDGTLRQWSTTAANNKPSGSTSIGSSLDDNLREIEKVVRQYLAAAGSSMASAATVDLATANGFYVEVSGTTTITAFGTEAAGIHYLLRFSGALTLTHNATSLILPGAANITTAAGDLAWFISEGSGNWRCAFYQVAAFTLANLDAQGDFIIAEVAGAPRSLQFPFGGAKIINGKIALSTGSSALTVALKGLNDSDPSATNPVFVQMPQGNPQDGTYSIRKVTAALSVVVSSGSTLGHESNVASSIYIYLLDNSGTLELAVSTKYFGDVAVASTTAEGGAGASDSATVMYSTTARTDVPVACLQRWKSTQTTAGTWAATTGERQLFPFPNKKASIQTFTSTGANTYTKPWDMLWARIQVQGAGGGGGGADTNGVANTVGVGGGGGGGGYSLEVAFAENISPTETATVGAGGTAGSATNGATGGTGGTSSFGSMLSATGGVGGTGSGVSAASPDGNAGGSGGAGASGNVNATGGDGNTSFAPASGGVGGHGGSSHFGGGGRAGVILAAGTAAAGTAGNTYGGGGGGGICSELDTGAAGGAGGNGIIIVEEFYT